MPTESKSIRFEDSRFQSVCIREITWLSYGVVASSVVSHDPSAYRYRTRD